MGPRTFQEECAALLLVAMYQGPPNETLFVTGLPMDCTSDFCKSVFGQYGAVKDANVLPVAAGKTAAAAFVEMTTTDDAKWIVEHVSGNVPQSLTNPVTIVFATPREQRKGSKGYGKGKGQMLPMGGGMGMGMDGGKGAALKGLIGLIQVVANAAAGGGGGGMGKGCVGCGGCGGCGGGCGGCGGCGGYDGGGYGDGNYGGGCGGGCGGGYYGGCGSQGW